MLRFGVMPTPAATKMMSVSSGCNAYENERQEAGTVFHRGGIAPRSKLEAKDIMCLLLDPTTWYEYRRTCNGRIHL